MSFATLREGAVNEVRRYVDLAKRLSEDYPDLKPEARANLLGAAPDWAYFVVNHLNPDSADSLLTTEYVVECLGTAAVMRATAARFLEIADQVDSVTAAGGEA